MIRQWKSVNTTLIVSSRNKWQLSCVSKCKTHHVNKITKEPIYKQRFNTVLSYHSPGFAAVIDQNGGATHINEEGDPIYSTKYTRTFGFYENLAAVQSSKEWFHILLDGMPAYRNRWHWCGNFQSSRCTVRNTNSQYFHIDPAGTIVTGPNSYAGDFREGAAVVRTIQDGLFRMIDENGRYIHPKNDRYAFLDLDVYHKGYARARDDSGWFFIDTNGEDVSRGQRYRQIENFYNGQALVQMLNDGSRCIINEQNEVLLRLDQCEREQNSDLEKTSRDYWIPFALKMGLEQMNDGRISEQVQYVWNDLGLLKLNPNHKTYSLTRKGELLIDKSKTVHDRVKYWLQDRFIAAWLPTWSFRNVTSTIEDHFSEISDKQESVVLNQRVLDSYAREDWNNIESMLPDDFFQSKTIVDLGGGLGRLLEQLSTRCDHQRLICIDRPEVIQMKEGGHPKIEFQPGDLFVGPLPKADYYILSRILHDWSDERARQILTRIPSDSLCVIEREVDRHGNQHALLSLHMSLLQQSKERTRDEWNHLFSSTGWKVYSRTSFSEHQITILKKMNYSNQHQSLKSIRKVVIPVAGLGTRMRPQTNVMPKALLPIILPDSKDGTCVPAFDILLQDIFATGSSIEQVLCVVAPNQWHLFQKYSTSKVKFVVQKYPRGFGHAILQTEPYINDEPFVVMLGDHLYQSNRTGISCLQQLLTAYREHLSNTSDIGLTGIMTCKKAEICQTGLVQTNHKMEKNSCFEIIDMAEKPSLDIVEQRFKSSMFSPLYLCQAGIDILPSSIFQQLRRDEQLLKTNELGLRQSMNNLRENGKLRGYLIDGTRFDIGNPKDYLHTIEAFSKLRLEGDQTIRYNKTNSAKSLLNKFPFIKDTLLFDSMNPIYAASAPARLDVMGGFADYSGAHVLQYPLAQRTYAFVQASDECNIRLLSVQVDDLKSSSMNNTPWNRCLPMSLLHSDPKTLRENLKNYYCTNPVMRDQPIDWPNYIVGILSKLLVLADSTVTPKGFNIVIVSDIPCNRGLASSAALEVAVASAVSRCLKVEEKLSKTELAFLCQSVENQVVGSPCGFMDQMTCVHGAKNHLLSLICQNAPNPKFHQIPWPEQLQLFAIDSGVKRSTASSTYGRIRTAAFLGRALMQLPKRITDLCQISLSDFNENYRHQLPESADGESLLIISKLNDLTALNPSMIYPIRAATIHPIEEHFRSQIFEKLIKRIESKSFEDDAINLGDLMFQSNAGYSSCDLQTGETKQLIRLIRNHRTFGQLIFGAKITGGGGGGTIAVMMKTSTDSRDALEEIIEQYQQECHKKAAILFGSSSGLKTYEKFFQ